MTLVNILPPVIALVAITIPLLLTLIRISAKIEGKVKNKVSVAECEGRREAMTTRVDAERLACQDNIKSNFSKLWKNYDTLSGEFRETKGQLVEAVQTIKEGVTELRRANGRK